MDGAGRLTRWVWRRHRRRLVGVLVLFVTVAIDIGLVAPVVAFGALYFEMTLDAALAWFGIAASVTTVGVGVSVISVWPRLRSVASWAQGTNLDPTDALGALLAMPRVLAVRTVLIEAPLHMLLTVPAGWVLGDFSALGTSVVAIVVLTVIAAGGVLAGFGMQLFLAPGLTEIAASLPATASPLAQGGWGVRTRLLWVTSSLMFLATMCAPPIVLLAEDPNSRIALAAACSIVITGYAVFVYNVGLVGPTVAPLVSLTDATDRVRRGTFDERVPVTSSDEFGHLAVAFNEMQHGLAQRESLHAAFGSYVDPGLAQRLIESGSSVFEGEAVDLSVLFADVRDFTSYAESVTAEEAVDRLNRLFDVVVPVLYEHGGHANHYLGDGLLAVFGAPQPLMRHADAAVEAAVAIQRAVRAEFGSGLRLGIGINTGPVIAGTVGGGGRHEFTVIGDTVNVAARVEQLTKETGDAILITEATRNELSSPRPRSTKRGRFDLKGKSSAVTAHAVNPFPRSTR